MANNGIKFENLFGGVRLVVRLEDGNTGSFSLSRMVGKFICDNVVSGKVFNPTKKSVKDAGLVPVDQLIEKVYWDLFGLECTKLMARERGEWAQKTEQDMLNLYRSLGIASDKRQWLFSKEYHTVADCFSVCVASKAVLDKDGNRLTCTSLTNFRKAVWNAIYVQSATIEGNVLEMSTSQTKQFVKFSKEEAKRAND